MPWISRSIVTMCFFSRKRFGNVINSSVIRIGCITKYSTGRRNEGISRNDTFLWHHKLTKQTFSIFNRCNTHSQKRTLNRIAIYRTCFFSIFRSILHLQRSFACFVGRYIAKSIWNSWNWSAVTRVNAHESSSNQLDTFMRFIILCAHFIWCQTKDSDLTKKIGAQETILIERRKKNIEEAAHQSKRLIVCHLPTHIFILVHRKHRNHKTIESNKFMDGFIEKTKPNENNRNLSKRDTNATWRKQYAAFVINERMNNKKWK